MFAKRILKVALFVAGVLSLLMTMGSVASASTGSFSKAVTNTDWTKAQISGTVSWGGCTLSSQIAAFHSGPSRCDSWFPVVMVQPALPSFQCSWRSAWESNRDIWQVWRGETQTSPGKRQSFNLSNAQILPGVQGQRVCLVALVFQRVTDETCKAIQYERQYMGLPTRTCQLIPEVSGEVISQSLLSEARPLGKNEAVRVAKVALGRKYGKSWRGGTNKKVQCRQSKTTFRCTAIWTSGGKPKRGTVSVPRL